AVESFLAGFSNFNSRPTTLRMDQPKKATAVSPPANSTVFYGLEGKRQAAVHFLSEVIAQSKPQTLLLFSDEATDWMTGNTEFAAKWASLMTQLFSKGNRIKIIHTVSRDLDEMLSAIRQWMPLYMTGLIEPYFYPKKRDAIFKHTLFVSPDVAAVVSNSVGTSIDCAANVFLRDKDMILAYAEEFHQYLSLCKPLMQIYTAKDTAAYFETLLEYETETSDSLIKTESLSSLTMPESVAPGIIARMNKNGLDLNALQDRRRQLFEANLKVNSFTEIIPMFDVEQVKRGAVKIAFSVMLLGDAACYTLEEYILHLEHLEYLLTHYDHFHLHLVKDQEKVNYMVYAREALGVIVGKTSAPPVALAINETNLATAFWDYLKSMLGEKACQHPNNAETAKKLSDYIQQLKQGLEQA
ncbi:MAG: transcriptional regulator, partial [Lawsonibacter sp.]